MATIHVVLDQQLPREADRVACRSGMSRSALIREVLRAHLAVLAARDRERADREGYLRAPDREFASWKKIASWPHD